MKNRLVLFLLCLATSGFGKFYETPAAVVGSGLRNHSSLAAGEFFGRALLHVDSVTSPAFSIGETKDRAGAPEPWATKQLMAPADLAAMINAPNSKKLIIICVGPGALIKGSLDMGPAKEKKNLAKLKQQLSKMPREANVVIYCGCCPFEHCPNIRPAFNLLKEMKFTNAHLLNLEHNIRTDWVAKGYPQA